MKHKKYQEKLQELFHLADDDGPSISLRFLVVWDRLVKHYLKVVVVFVSFFCCFVLGGVLIYIHFAHHFLERQLSQLTEHSV